MKGGQRILQTNKKIIFNKWVKEKYKMERKNLKEKK
jgi:hypothetical protein